MLWFKACPRCKNGDLELGKDMYGWNILCLQCGYMRDLKDRSQILAELTAEEAAPPAYLRLLKTEGPSGQAA